MRILLINCVYQEGSTGKIVKCLTEELQRRGHEVLCCYGNGKEHYDQYSIKICSNIEHKFNALLGRITGLQYGGVYLSNKRFERLVNSFNPDIVHIHCINGSIINVYSLLEMLARKKVNTVVSLHAEIFHTGGCSHAFDCEKWKHGCHHCEVFKKECCSYFFDRSEYAWKKIRDAFQSFDKDKLVITAVSPWLAERAKQSDVLKGFQVYSVMNGLSTDVFHYEKSSIIPNPDNKKIALFVAPYFNLVDGDLKGGKYVVELAKKLPDYLVVVVASRIANDIPKLPDNILIWGKAKNQNELALIYSQANVTVLFSSRETFSMVTAESLCCGTPVIGFNAGGPESIALPEFSKFVGYGRIYEIETAVRLLEERNFGKDEISQLACNKYSDATMTNAYYAAYHSLKS